MSLAVAEAWVRSAIRQPAAQQDALRLFEQASSDQVDATLIVAPELTKKRRSYLVRWTGRETVVLELSPHQQNSFGLVPFAMFKQLEARNTMSEIPCQPWVTLSSIRFDTANSYDCSQPLTGRCTYSVDESETKSLWRCALRAEYFRPDMPRPITAFWYIDAPPSPPQGELNFRFTPIRSVMNPVDFSGPLVLFLQLCSAQDWVRQQGLQRISNVTAAVIEIR